ncbi:hypothetical protein BLA24_08915 [Streptomyces cinnamoneus]|uniref:Uncharacterized protein n=1 Tax=Streptomyces cinnamoneus TaxID=53446 RepID=A0A2G1XMC5_STRCJ|nr:hypothetical protein [Streptomyces cinnamoneus]PHQ52289.1 hypothetical protein BLA24_08915 [Streptomyces cinnamoneus]PPT16344.1 hypothetical protein CYQ11_04170 [Streptomyces cinnamoneus]
MDPITLAAGTALVGAIATDGWVQVRETLVGLWRRASPEQADVIDAELVEARAQVLAARQAGEGDAEQVLAAAWQSRLQALLHANPAVAVELRQLLDTRLGGASASEEGVQSGVSVMRAEASGSGRVYQAGRDQHITER